MARFTNPRPKAKKVILSGDLARSVSQKFGLCSPLGGLFDVLQFRFRQFLFPVHRSFFPPIDN